MSVVWLDGRFLPENRATVRATDPAFLHGRGLFETLRAYNGIPFRVRDHVDRMAASARHFKIPFHKSDFDSVIRELCRRNRLADAAVRITLSAEGKVLVTARPRRKPPAAWFEKGARISIVQWRRDIRSPLAGHKVTSYLENVVAHDSALRQGCADALYVGLNGELLEGCVTNVFLVLNGKLVTPKLGGILPGVTRKVVMELAPTKERSVRMEELRRADEAFLTNSLIEVLPIGKPGPIGKRISEAYRELTRGLV